MFFLQAYKQKSDTSLNMVKSSLQELTWALDVL